MSQPKGTVASEPHSKTVRGTLSNPKTQEAMKSDKPTPSLGDHGSLSAESSGSKAGGDKTAQDSGTVKEKQGDAGKSFGGKKEGDSQGGMSERDEVNESHLKSSEMKKGSKL